MRSLTLVALITCAAVAATAGDAHAFLFGRRCCRAVCCPCYVVCCPCWPAAPGTNDQEDPDVSDLPKPNPIPTVPNLPSLEEILLNGLDAFTPPPPTLSPAGTPRQGRGATAATIVVELPAGAALSISGQPTIQTGSVRTFLSPELAGDGPYNYELVMTVVRDGRTVQESREITVWAGRATRVQFGAPATPSTSVQAAFGR